MFHTNPQNLEGYTFLMCKQNSSYGGVLQTSFPFLKRQTVLNIPLLFNEYYICIDLKK